MKILHVLPRISEEASGPTHSVPQLCQALAGHGVNVELHVNTGSPPNGAAYNVISHGEWAWPRRIGVSPRMRCALSECTRHAQIIHNHSLWCMANVYAGVAARHSEVRLVLSPRGTLSANALKISRLAKFAFWHLGQSETVKRADCLHATSESEYEDIREAGLKQPVAVIPNGVELPSQIRLEVDAERLRTVLFLGRLHPIKGIDLLIRAWANVENDFPEWKLQIAGPGERAYRRSLEALSAHLGLKRVYFLGPVYGLEKTRTFYESELFVLPSYSENFGMVVAEALAHGLPAIVTEGAPWQGLEAHQCGWWISRNEKALTKTLINALSMTEGELSNAGARGAQWMNRDFRWERIAKLMVETYDWLLGDGAEPACMRFD